MTDKENQVRQCEINVQIAQSKLNEARALWERGEEEATAIYEKTMEKLGREMERGHLEVDKEKAWLEKAKADLEKPFTNSQEN